MSIGRVCICGHPRAPRANCPEHGVKTMPVPWAAFQYFMPFLVALVITMAIPCFNTANMMLARAAGRQR